MRIYMLHSEDQTSNQYIAIAIRNALARHPEVEKATLGDYSRAVEEFRAGEYDIFLCLGSAGSHASLQHRLSGMARISILWTTEDPYELMSNIAMSKHYDVVFTNDLASIPAYRGRARHLPLAAARDFNDFDIIKDDSKYRYDLFFVGTAWPNRVATINRIISYFGSGIKFKIALPYNGYLAKPELIDSGLLINWRCSNFEFARLANASRIVLSLQRRFTAASDGVAAGSTPPPRLFETGLSGGLQVFASNSEEAKRYYRDGEEFQFCGSDEDLIPTIRDALSNPARRIAMAQAARERTLKEHTYERRVECIVEAARSATLRQPLRRKPRTILIVTHNVLTDRLGGGVEIYQQYLSRIGINWRVLFLYPTQSEDRFVLRMIDNAKTKDYLLTERINEGDIYHASAEHILEEILITESVDLVHFQHLIGLPLSLPLIVKAYGIPAIYTYHDHFLTCSQYMLLNYEDRYCQANEKTLAQCDICLNAKGQVPPGSQARRRAFIARLLEALDIVIVNTPFSADYLKAIYGIAEDKVRVLEMMLPRLTKPKHGRKSVPFKWDSAEPLRVAIPGNFTNSKGANYIIRAMNALRDSNIEFTILGRVDDQFYSILKMLDMPNVTMLGGYNQSKIFEILVDFDVSLHLSIWPETYVIALSEAWAAGLIPIVTDLGAQGERVTDGVDGFKIAPHDAGAIMDVLQQIRWGFRDLDAMRATIAEKSFPGPLEHLRQLSTLYDELTAAKPLVQTLPLQESKLRFDLTAFACNARMNSQRWTSSAIEWDESINDVSPPPIQLHYSQEFPIKYRHLQTTKIKLGQKVNLHYDSILIDGEDVKSPAPLVANALHAMALSGWIVVDTKLTFVEMFAELSSATGGAYVTVPTFDRPDVESHFGTDNCFLGFHASLPISTLENGVYSIHFHLVFDGLVISVEDVGSVKLGGYEKQDDIWSSNSNNLICGKPVIQISTGAVLVEPESYVDFLARKCITVSGWANPPAGFNPARRIALAICDGSNQILNWAEVAPCLRPASANRVDQMLAFTGFSDKLRTPELPPNSAKLIIVQDFGDQIGVTDVLNFPAEVHAKVGDAGFKAFIDKIDEIAGTAGERLSIEGWMFLAGHGEPLDVFIRWPDETGTVQAMPSLRQHRFDVGTALVDSAANVAGYRVEIDKAVLLKSPVTLCQVYKEAIVVFDDFGEAVQASLSSVDTVQLRVVAGSAVPGSQPRGQLRLTSR